MAMKRRPNTESVQWFLERAADGSLDLEPRYQRRTVWSLDYRQKFIDTVLRNYPCPAIFLSWEIVPGVSTRYAVVDGKQRLTAILDFVADEFHLGDLFAGEGMSEAYWSDLTPEYQGELANYLFTVENITGASETELRTAFDRLNRNVARLTPQELRHAQFEGVFLQRMEGLAEIPFWTEAKIATAANVRRMRDIEFVSELFLLTMHGVLDGNAVLLDTYYAKYDNEIPDEAEHRLRFEETLNWIEKLPLDWKKTRWSNMSDFYGLWGAVLELADEGRLTKAATAAKRLTAFSETQAEINAALKAETKPPGKSSDRRYYDASRQGPNKDTNRRTRIAVLVDHLGK